jgi:hypothetical protein
MLNFSPILGINSSRLGTIGDRSLPMLSTARLSRNSKVPTLNLERNNYLGRHVPLVHSDRFLSVHPERSEIGWDNWNPLDSSMEPDNFDRTPVNTNDNRLSRQPVARINDTEQLTTIRLNSAPNLASTILTTEPVIDDRSTTIQAEPTVQKSSRSTRSKSKQKSQSKSQASTPDLIQIDPQQSSAILSKQISPILPATAPTIVEPISTSILVDRINTNPESIKELDAIDRAEIDVESLAEFAPVDRTNISPTLTPIVSKQLDADISTESNLQSKSDPASSNIFTRIVEPTSTSILVDRINTNPESPAKLDAIDRPNISPAPTPTVSKQIGADIPTEFNLQSNPVSTDSNIVTPISDEIVEPISTSILVDRINTNLESPAKLDAVDRPNISPAPTPIVSEKIDPNISTDSNIIRTIPDKIVEPISTSILVDRINTNPQSPAELDTVDRTNISPTPTPIVSAKLDLDISTDSNIVTPIPDEIVAPISTSILVDRINTNPEYPDELDAIDRTNISPTLTPIVSAKLDPDISTDSNIIRTIPDKIVEPISTSILVNRINTNPQSPAELDTVDRPNISPTPTPIVSAQLDPDISTDSNIIRTTPNEIVEPISTAILVDRINTNPQSPAELDTVDRTNISPTLTPIVSAKLDPDISTDSNIIRTIPAEILEPISTAILVDRINTNPQSPAELDAVDRTNISPAPTPTVSQQLDTDIPTESNLQPKPVSTDSNIVTPIFDEIVEPISTSILVDRININSESPAESDAENLISLSSQLPTTSIPVNELRAETESQEELISEQPPSLPVVINNSLTSIPTTQSNSHESELTEISDRSDRIIPESIQTNPQLETRIERNIQSEDLSLDPTNNQTEIDTLIPVQGYATGGSVKESEPTMQIMRDRLDLKSIATSDTVAAMLTPGEFVINAKDAQKNLNLLTHINSGGEPQVNTPNIASDSQTGIATAANSIQRKNYDPFTPTASSRSIDLHQISFLHKSPLDDAQTSQTEHHQSPSNYSSPAMIFRQPRQNSQSEYTRIDRTPDAWDSIEELINGDNYSSDNSNFTDRSSSSKLNNYSQIESRAAPTISPQFITPVRGFATGGEVTPSDISTTIAPITHTIRQSRGYANESPILDTPQQPENNDPAELEILAREIYHRLRQRLEIERERHGSYSGNLPW